MYLFHSTDTPMLKKTLFSLIACLVIQPLFAQDMENRVTLDLKAGFSIPVNHDIGILLGTDVSLFRGETMYTIGYNYFSEFTIWNSAAYETQQIDFLVGKQLNLKIIAWHLQGGVGPVWGDYRTSNGREDYFTAGLFIRVGSKFIPIKYAGISADLELNINPKNPTLLFTFGISLGQMHTYDSD